MKVKAELYKVTVNVSAPGYPPSAEVFATTQAKFDGLDFVELAPFDPESTFDMPVLVDSELVLDRAQMAELTIRNLPITVGQVINTNIDITRQLMEWAEKPVKLSAQSAGDTYNNTCEVHMPGHSLSLYNEMLLLEDACTDVLQGSLNSGWRIVAACHQPDQRRPDYIMGRFNPDYDCAGSAERTA